MLKKLMFGIGTLGLCSSLALAALNAGDKAPDFRAPAALSGKTIDYSLRSELRKGPVVVYFYPSAYTNGCNLQAHTFATQYEKFTAAGTTIVGVSLDSIGRLTEFSADPDFCAGKVTVASDADGSIARTYGLNIRDAVAGRKDTRGNEIDHGFAERTTFVIDTDGRVVATIGGLTPVENVSKALETVQGLQRQKSK